MSNQHYHTFISVCMETGIVGQRWIKVGHSVMETARWRPRMHLIVKSIEPLNNLQTTTRRSRGGLSCDLRHLFAVSTGLDLLYHLKFILHSPVKKALCCTLQNTKHDGKQMVSEYNLVVGFIWTDIQRIKKKHWRP